MITTEQVEAAKQTYERARDSALRAQGQDYYRELAASNELLSKYKKMADAYEMQGDVDED